MSVLMSGAIGRNPGFQLHFWMNDELARIEQRADMIGGNPLPACSG